jgi:hypothetical protein
MNKKFLSILLLAVPVFLNAQDCSRFPADCPEDFSHITDSLDCISNSIVSQEITMQNRLRELTTEMMQKIAAAKNWDFYEINEAGYGQFVNPPNAPAYVVPFPYRSPHEYNISFEFIVNPDSLNAWKDWYHNEYTDNANKIADSYKQQVSDPAFQETQKSYMDSMNYWTKAQTDYMTNHMETYQKALLSKDDAGIKSYENAISWYQKKTDYWIKKATSRNDEALSGPDQAHEKFQNRSRIKKSSYRNKSIIRIKISFNQVSASAFGGGTPQFVKQIPVQGAVLASQFHNNDPDELAIFDLDQFHRATDLVFILFGKWKINQNPIADHEAVYRLDKKNTDYHFVKSITCEKIQTISVHIEGGPVYMEEFMRLFESQKLHGLIVKE